MNVQENINGIEYTIYTTNNLLLILDGDRIIKELYFEERCMMEEYILEYREIKSRSSSHSILQLAK